jgi:hypothetical protein
LENAGLLVAKVRSPEIRIGSAAASLGGYLQAGEFSLKLHYYSGPDPGI